MIKITSQQADILLDNDLAGIDTEWGAIIGDHNWIVLCDNSGYTLFHRLEYQSSDDGCFCRPYHPENSSLPNLEDILEVREL